MAFMNQTKKQELSGGIKAVLKKYGVKGTIAVRHHMALEVNLTEGPLDFFGKYIKSAYAMENMAQDWKPSSLQLAAGHDYSNTWEDPTICAFLDELSAAMMVGNHNNSDIMTDYFDIGWFADINVGKWNRKYVCTAAA